MIGAIIGDIVGSRFERRNNKCKDNFELFAPRCRFTDDSAMTLAVANALLDYQGDQAALQSRAVTCMQAVGRKYPAAGYGWNFEEWLFSDEPEPYESWGNGAAMRISGCAYVSEDLDECLRVAETVTNVSHNHEESILAARAVTTAIFMARHGSTMQEIRQVIEAQYDPIAFTLDEIRPTYKFEVACRGSVPQAFAAFFEAVDFEDAIRNAISVGGDSDTIACITGGIAEAYFGVPAAMREAALTYLPDDLKDILIRFEARFPGKTV